MYRSLNLLALAAALAGACAPVVGHAAESIVELATTYEPAITETVDDAGFTHPGIGLTRQMLEDLRTQVRAQKEPWNTYFNQMLRSPAAARNVVSSNQSATDPALPASTAFSSQAFQARFIADALKAYTQAVLYIVTGDQMYRANAMRILRIWQQMVPAQYAYYSDAHIHSGIPLNRMVAAAELMRYSTTTDMALEWTAQDTARFATNLVVPVTEVLQHKNSYFMNQHLYPLIGAMSGYIFTGNRARYNEGVEWFTVNHSAVDQGQNGAIKQLFRLVTKNDLTGEAVPPVVQHVEMGRDQAHGAGDITNAAILARLLLAQGTRVDPVAGTVSAAANAVGPYEFLDDRILDASEYFARYMNGYDTPWVPTASHTDAAGNPTIVYRQLATEYRGRLTQNTWDQFYYYKYARGLDMAVRAPYLTQLFKKRLSYNWDGVDGGGDFWLYLPPAAEAEGADYLVRPVVEPVREIEDRYTALDDGAAAAHDGTAGYVRVTGTAAGSRLAVLSYANAARSVALRVRTNGVATLDVFDDRITVPDTQGQWRYLHYAFNDYQRLGDFVSMTIRGAGTSVDLDHIHVQPDAVVTPPVFVAGHADLHLTTTAGSQAPLTYSFAASGGNAASPLSYRADQLPPGASFDTASGAFSWLPQHAGTHAFVVSTSDGTTVTARNVTVTVAVDRLAAVTAASAGYQGAVPYTRATLAAYQSARSAAVAATAGTVSDAVFGAALSALGSATAALAPLTPLLPDGSMNYATLLAASTFGNEVPNALDGSPVTFVVYTRAQNRTHTFDFGADYKVAASAFRLQVRASFPDRIGGIAMFGSNDNQNWTRLTPGMTVVTEDLQTLDVAPDLQDQRYRFLKMQMVQPSGSMLEVAEFHIVGRRYEAVNELASVSIGSAQALRNRIVPGNTVQLAVRARTPISNLAATVQGVPATASSTDGLNWTLAAPLGTSAAPGPVRFAIHYQTADGLAAEPALFTTDGTALYLADLTGQLADVADTTTLTDSNGRNPADVLAAARLLFDGNVATFTDFRAGGSGSGGYLRLDFRPGGSVSLARVELLARQDTYASRIKGTVVQGSNDNATWTNLTAAAADTADWQVLATAGAQPYRYLRLYNAGNWFGNMAEVRLYGTRQYPATP